MSFFRIIFGSNLRLELLMNNKLRTVQYSWANSYTQRLITNELTNFIFTHTNLHFCNVNRQFHLKWSKYLWRGSRIELNLFCKLVSIKNKEIQSIWPKQTIFRDIRIWNYEKKNILINTKMKRGIWGVFRFYFLPY